MVAAYNSPPEFMEWVAQNPIRPGRHSGSARAALERRTVHIPFSPLEFFQVRLRTDMVCPPSGAGRHANLLSNAWQRQGQLARKEASTCAPQRKPWRRITRRAPASTFLVPLDSLQKASIHHNDPFFPSFCRTAR